MATPAFEDIAETFDFLDNWEDRYRHVIELGRAMPPMGMSASLILTSAAVSAIAVAPVLGAGLMSGAGRGFRLRRQVRLQGVKSRPIAR